MRKKEIVCQLLYNIDRMGFILKERKRNDDRVLSLYNNEKEKRIIELEVRDDAIIFGYQEIGEIRNITIRVYYDEDQVAIHFNRVDTKPKYVNLSFSLAKEPELVNDDTQEVDEKDYIDIINNMGIVTDGNAKLEELNLIYRTYCYFSNDFNEYDKYENEYREIQKLLNG